MLFPSREFIHFICSNREESCSILFTCLFDDGFPFRNSFYFFRESHCDLTQLFFITTNTWHTSNSTHALLVQWIWINTMLLVHSEYIFNSPVKDWSYDLCASVVHRSFW